MGAPKGHVKAGGRVKGTPNKSTQTLRSICELHGVNPFEGMVLIAKAELDPDRKFEKLERICQYIEPKRRAIEHSGHVSQSILDEAESMMNLTKEELLKVVQEEMKKVK